MTDLRTQVDFSIIRYANCWEDADVLLQSLQLPPQSKIACIASAGDNALALLHTQPQQVVAFDISPVQLYLTELKKCAFAVLNYEELLAFLSVKNSDIAERLKLYNRIQPALSKPAADYWNTQKVVIARGVIHAGKFEHYFAMFRRWFLPLVHSQKTVRQLLQLKTDTAQKEFYHSTWNNRRWQWLMAFFFSKKVMGKYGRDPQFLKQVQVPVSEFIRQKAANHLQSAYCTRNAFLQMIFTGNYQHSLPFYLRRENFEVIKNNLDKLQLIQADAQQVIEQQTYDAYCLSNIFEYMPAAGFEALVNEWKMKIPKHSKLAFWNLMATRSFAETAPEFYTKLPVDDCLLQQDNGFFLQPLLPGGKTMNDWLAILKMAVPFLLLFIIAEWLYHKLKLPAEFTRKLVHVVTGLLTFLFPGVFSHLWQVVVICAAFLLILLLSMRYRLLPSINAVERRTWGSVLFPVVVVIMFAFYHFMEGRTNHFRPVIFFYLPILIMAIADPAAAAVGKRFSGHSAASFAGKTVAGSAAFFITALVLSLCLMFTLTDTGFTGGIWYVLLIAFVTTIAERISSKGWDNFTIPLSAAGLLYLIA